jgi:uncharacterized protein (TIGR03000 family)
MGSYSTGYGDPNQTTAPPLHGGAQASGAIAPDRGRLRVQVPASDVRLWVNNQFVQLSGTERVFDVGVTGGQPQRMTLTAQWIKDGREVVRKKEVDVRPGQETSVTIDESDDASRPQGEPVPVTPSNPIPPQN